MASSYVHYRPAPFPAVAPPLHPPVMVDLAAPHATTPDEVMWRASYCWLPRGAECTYEAIFAPSGMDRFSRLREDMIRLTGLWELRPEDRDRCAHDVFSILRRRLERRTLDEVEALAGAVAEVALA